MYNKSYEQFITIKAAIEAYTQQMRANKQDSDEKMTEFKTMLAVIKNQINTVA